MDVPSESAPEQFGQVGGYLEKGETAYSDDTKIRVGMILYMATDWVVAIFVLNTYIWLRDYNTSSRWWSAAVGTQNLLYTTVVMGVLIIGAIVFAVGQWALNQGKQDLFRWMMAGAFFIVIFDLAIQVWSISKLPFGPLEGSFASSYLFLAGYHVYHLALGILLMLGIVTHAFGGEYTREKHPGVWVVGIYYYWITLYAILFWAMPLIQPPNLH